MEKPPLPYGRKHYYYFWKILFFNEIFTNFIKSLVLLIKIIITKNKKFIIYNILKILLQYVVYEIFK